MLTFSTNTLHHNCKPQSEACPCIVAYYYLIFLQKIIKTREGEMANNSLSTDDLRKAYALLRILEDNYISDIHTSSLKFTETKETRTATASVR